MVVVVVVVAVAEVAVVVVDSITISSTMLRRSRWECLVCFYQYDQQRKVVTVAASAEVSGQWLVPVVVSSHY